MPFAHAALIEAVSVAVHAVSLTPIALDDTVVVVGAGMIGLLTLQAALLAGAGRVFVIDLDDTRLELARSLGAAEYVQLEQLRPHVRKFAILPRAEERILRWSASAFRLR